MSDNLDTVETPLAPPEDQKQSDLPVNAAEAQQDLSLGTELKAPEATSGEGLPQDMQQATAGIAPAEVDTATAEEAEQPFPEEPDADAVQKTGMTDMFSEEYAYLQPKRGEIRQAQIITISDDGVMVDLGLKREGLIPAYDLQRVGGEAADALSVGDEIPVYIVRPEDREGNVVVSWYRARQEQDWLDAQELLESGETWEGSVRGYNRGGLIVPYGKIRGFVPASHVTGISRRMNHASVQARLAEMVGQTLPLKVLEVNRQSRRLILSERIARRQWRAQKREQLLDELQEGQIVHGVVSNICDFGVFVDIGGTDGLVHISELSWRRVRHPSELLSTGTEVDAYVLRVDRQRKRIGLSLRLLEPDPWDSAEEKYQVGGLVTGVVTKLTDFGAFAALEDGIEGLIHISELAEIPPRHPSEVIARDAELPLLVVKVDSRRKRMGLSLKRVSEEEWYQWEEARRAKAAPEPEEPEEEPAVEEMEAEELVPTTEADVVEAALEADTEAVEIPLAEAVAEVEAGAETLAEEAQAVTRTEEMVLVAEAEVEATGAEDEADVEAEQLGTEEVGTAMAESTEEGEDTAPEEKPETEEIAAVAERGSTSPDGENPPQDLPTE